MKNRTATRAERDVRSSSAYASSSFSHFKSVRYPGSPIFILSTSPIFTRSVVITLLRDTRFTVRVAKLSNWTTSEITSALLAVSLLMNVTFDKPLPIALSINEKPVVREHEFIKLTSRGRADEINRSTFSMTSISNAHEINGELAGG